MSANAATERAARIDVIRAAARHMQDTDDDFYTTLGKWLTANALVLEVSLKHERIGAYQIAECYLRNRERLQRRLP